MSLESLSSSAVKFVPWPLSWEEGIEMSSNGRVVAPSFANQKNFTETERELLHRGIDLIVGVKEARSLEKESQTEIIVDPASTHSTGHFIVKKIPGPSKVITLQKEGTHDIILQAVKQHGGKEMWKITSPVMNLGECVVMANAKKSSFYLLRDGHEEVAIHYRKASGNTKLRFFDVIIPALQKETGKHAPVRFDGVGSYLLAQAPLETIPSDCIKLTVREPQLRDHRWVLMFNGRVKRSSSRNFILIHPGQPAREILLCGKCGVKEFVFDLNWPLSIIQGFGIYLTLFSKPKPN